MSKVRPPQPFLFSCPPLSLLLSISSYHPLPFPCTFSSSVLIFCTEINLHKQLIYFTYVMVMLFMFSTSIASLIISFLVHSFGPPIFSVPRLFTSLIPKCDVDLFFPFNCRIAFQSGISLCCSGTKPDAYGFRWRFYEGPPIDCENKTFCTCLSDFPNIQLSFLLSSSVALPFLLSSSVALPFIFCCSAFPPFIFCYFPS